MASFTRLFRSAKKPTPVRKARLGVLSLEAREVPSTTLVNGVLSVNGSAGNDTIVIASPTPTQTVVRVNGVVEFSDIKPIRKIVVDGGSGDDVVQLRGYQTGVVDGVEIAFAEDVTIGDRLPNQTYSMSKIRSQVIVDDVDLLTLNNSASTANQNIHVDYFSVSGMSAFPIFFNVFTAREATDRLVIQSGSGNDAFRVVGAPLGFTSLKGFNGTDTFDLDGNYGRMEVNGQAGADTINIAPNARTLGVVFKPIRIVDGRFEDKITIFDQNSGTSLATQRFYQAGFSADRLDRYDVQRTANGDSQEVALIEFDRPASVDFKATGIRLGATLSVASTNAKTKTSIDAGAVESVYLGSASLLDSIDGPVAIKGDSATRLVLDDSRQPISGHRYTFNAGSIQRAGMATVNVASFDGSIEVFAGDQADVFDFKAQRAGGLEYSLIGNGGDDTIIAPQTDNAWRIVLGGRGALNESTKFESVENLIGNSKADTFHFNFNFSTVPGKIDGGGGFDTLDYQALTNPVAVDLQAGSATNVALGVIRIRNVFGGSANDLLVGNGGSNVLLGNGGDDVLAGGLGGRDLMVGGSGLDTLSSRSDLSTIYIGGNLATADRNNVDSLRAIMSEWNSANLYSQRVTNLQNGVGINGSVKLNSNTLKSDSAKDVYSQSLGRDFFVIDTFDAFAEGKRPGADERVISLAVPGSKG